MPCRLDATLDDFIISLFAMLPAFDAFRQLSFAALFGHMPPYLMTP